MIKQLITSLLLFISCSAKADFVDIAILKVNGVLVRKLTNNNQNPYFVNLSRFHVGDTLSIKVRTDHGAEEHSYITLKNLENNHHFVLDKENRFIISNELLQKKHLLSVTYVRDYPEEMEITWDVCKIIPNDQIEKVYTSINELRDLLISVSNGKPKFSASILKDSITTNYYLRATKKGFFEKVLKDTLNYSINKISDFLVLNQSEKTFIKQIDAIDYVKLHDFTGNMYGSIRTGDDGIDTFCFFFGDHNYRLEFHFVYMKDKYLLEEIFYNTN